MKVIKTYIDFQRALRFLKQLDFRFYQFLIPAGLSLLAAVSEGASVSLLVPLIQGLIKNDYSFALNIPVLKNILEILPVAANHRNASLFASITALIFTVAVAQHVFFYFSSLTVAFYIRKVTHQLRVMVYNRCIHFSKHFFDQLNPGQFHQIVNGYTRQAAEKMGELNDVIYMLLLVIVYFGVMLVISWQLTFVVITAFPILHVVITWVIKKISLTSQDYAHWYTDLGKKLSNVLSIIPLIKAYHAEDKEVKEFTKFSLMAEQLQFSIDKKTLLIRPIQEIIMLFMVLCLIGVVALFFMEQKPENAAGYMVFFFVLKRCVTCFGVFNHFRASLASLKGPAQQIRKMLSQPYQSKFSISTGTCAFEGVKHSIKFDNVNFAYPDKANILSNINLTVAAGKMTAILGTTGSGKTTIINLLLRYYDDYQGRILIDDVDIRDIAHESLLSKFAVVSQNIELFDASLRENLLYFIERDTPEEEINQALKQVELFDIVQQLPQRLETRIGDRGVQLSGGEKQRLAIARAILKKADILIFDEATSAIDSSTEALIKQAILGAVKGKTSIVVTHRLINIRDADNIVFIENGHIAEEGIYETLMATRGKFYRHWNQYIDNTTDCRNDVSI